MLNSFVAVNSEPAVINEALKGWLWLCTVHTCIPLIWIRVQYTKHVLDISTTVQLVPRAFEKGSIATICIEGFTYISGSQGLLGQHLTVCKL